MIETYIDLGPHEMESPLMNAGGVVKTIEDVRLMSQTAVGAVLAGSYTIEPRAGNGADGQTVYYHDVAAGKTYNALGMPNKGLDAVAAELPTMIKIAHDAGKPFVLNFAPVTDKPLVEVIQMCIILARHDIDNLDAIELNASCPNVVTHDGGRHELLSHHPEQLGRVLFELNDIRSNEVPFNSLWVRVSPFRSPEDAVAMAQVVQETNTNVVSAFNTFPGGQPVTATGENILQVPGGIGGQSGRAMSKLAEDQTKWLMDARSEIKADFAVVGSNGIANAESMKRRLDLGVAAVSATTLFYESRSWGSAVDELLAEYASLV